MRRERLAGIGTGLIAGLVFGAAAGALTALLTAPVTGREARRRLGDARRQVLAQATDLVARVTELGDAVADWATQVVGAEARRTRSRIAELRADVERLAASRQ